MAVKNYDPKEMSLVVAGIPIDSGFADGSFIKISHTSPRFKSKASADGEVSRAKQNDRRAKVTITLMQTSSCNAKLSALAALDDAAPNGAGVGPFLLRDRQGTSVRAGSSCWVSELPEEDYDLEPTTRAWLIEVADMSGVIGGN